MRNLIVGIIAGIILGSTSIAGAQVYWSERGSGYSCQGIASGASCNAGNYQVGVTRDFVYVQHRRTEQTFGCRKRASFRACVSD